MSDQEFRKADGGKARYDLLPPHALDEIAHVLAHGAVKHGADNWRENPEWSSHFAASMRHMWAYWSGQDLDPESQRHHLAHAACRILFLLECARCDIGIDDRPRGKS